MSRLVRRLRGWRQRRLILSSGVFDRVWYLTRYPDVLAAGLGPIRHYVSDGWRSYYANAIFDGDWYREHYGAAVGNPLVDYLLRGATLGRDPNRWFDTAWYRRTHLGGSRAIDPMRHYLEGGAAAGCQPSEAFARLDREVLRLAESHPDLAGHATPLGFFLQAYRMTGAIDTCTTTAVAGFAARHVGPQLVVTVRVDGVAQGTVVPWIPRPDVFDGLGVIGVGFVFRFPVPPRPGDMVDLQDEFGQTLVACRRVVA